MKIVQTANGFVLYVNAEELEILRSGVSWKISESTTDEIKAQMIYYLLEESLELGDD